MKASIPDETIKKPDFHPSTRENPHSISSSSQSSWPPLFQEEDDLVIEPGTVIVNKYRLEEEIGDGGMSVIWKATDLVQDELDQRDSAVAIKFLNQKFKQHKDARQALKTEYKRYKMLRHSNIISVNDLNRTGHDLFMVMEFLKGISLKQLIKEHPDGLTFEEAKPIIQGMCDALIHAHEKGIAHLDFKPENVFYEPTEGVTKVIDFGIARRLDEAQRELTVFDPGELKAQTKSYASYEMIMNLEPKREDDVYALACVTYELLSGQHPFYKDDRKKTAAEAEDENLSFIPIKTLERQQNRALQRALALRRRDRTQTVSQFVEEFFAEPNNRIVWVSALVFLFTTVAVAAVFFTKWEAITQNVTETNPPVEEAQKIERLPKETVSSNTQIDRIEPTIVGSTTSSEKEAKRDSNPVSAFQGLKNTNDVPPQAKRLAVEQEEARKNQLLALLQTCQEHFKAVRLVPASECYQKVVERQSENAHALKGLEDIEARYVKKAETALSQKQFDAVKKQLTHLEKLNPQSAKLAELKQDLEQAENAQRVAEEKRQQEKAKQAKIATLLKDCQVHLDANRLTTGRGGTAWACYQEVLTLEPSNTQALVGFHKIEARYVGWAEKALDKKQVKKAKRYLASLEKVNPKSPALADLKQRVQETKVADLLRQCQRHLDANRLTTGREGTALTCYQEVLKLDQGNGKALAGLKEIEDRYVGTTESALDKKQLNKAKTYLASLEKVNPKSPALAELKQRLEAAGEKPEIIIADLLRQCQEHLYANRITTGRRGNALFCYQDVLKLDSNNAEAWRGLEAIGNYYVTLAETALRNRQVEDVKKYLTSLNEVNSQAFSVSTLKKQYQQIEVEANRLYQEKQKEQTLQEHVSTLLKTCQQHFDSGRITSGIRGTAFDCYQSVLVIEENNASALAGLKRIEDYYRILANTALDDGRFDDAERYIANLEKVNPQLSNLANLRQRLADIKN